MKMGAHLGKRLRFIVVFPTLLFERQLICFCGAAKFRIYKIQIDLWKKKIQF